MDNTVKWHLSYLLSPYVIFSGILLALNDHYLKVHFPNELTGKLSDFAGVFLFPIFLCATWTIFSGKDIRRNNYILAAVITVVIMLVIKVIPGGNQFYLRLLKFVGINGFSVADPSDLISLVMLWPSFLFMQSWWSIKNREP